LRILFIADVVGVPGRRAIDERLPSLRVELRADLCIANGENVADGVGITPKLADRLLASGVDAITLGNHVWRRGEIVPYLKENERIVRPANMSRRAPGRGMTFVAARDGTEVAVINLLGVLFLSPTMSPIEIADMHAEATSEKVAMARLLDGRATAVIGTHTHVQTNDARVLPGGTAAISDAGMTGPHDSVIGVEAELAIRSMRTAMPVRFETAQGDVRIEGVLIECDADGRAVSCEPVRVPVP